jgi:choline dehydrogenase
VSFGLDNPNFMEWRANITSRGRALLMLFLFSDVGEMDAPTRIRVGSHIDIARILAPARDKGLTLGELAAHRFDETAHREEVLATGESGTVYLCHPFPSMRAFVEASAAIGLPRISDFNGATQHGVGPYPLNVVDGVRINTGMAYLTAAVRARSNLAIRGDAEVDGVVIEGKRAVGVKLVDGEVLSAGEVILAAGVFGSPAILLRSGIGPSQHLSEIGIATIADLPVGNRLQDQPFFYNVYALKREANAMKPAAGAIIWTRSQTAGPADLDLHISGTHLIDPNASPTGGAIVLACAVTLPKSIGRLRLSSRDPRVAPHIHYNFFDDQNDLDRLLEAVQLSRKIGRTAPLSDLIDHEMAPGNAVDNDEALRGNIVANIAAYLHGTSTVPMGADSDPTAVVDAWGKVRGVEALRVVDASILPEIPSVGTNVTTIMLAERIAAKLSGEHPVLGIQTK